MVGLKAEGATYNTNSSFHTENCWIYLGMHPIMYLPNLWSSSLTSLYFSAGFCNGTTGVCGFGRGSLLRSTNSSLRETRETEKDLTAPGLTTLDMQRDAVRPTVLVANIASDDNFECSRFDWSDGVGKRETEIRQGRLRCHGRFNDRSLT